MPARKKTDPTTYFAKLKSGAVGQRHGGARTYTADDYTAMNAIPGRTRYTAAEAQKLTLKDFKPSYNKRFASQADFNEWFQALDGQARERYKDYKVALDGDGTVLVWREINQIEGYQSDGDRLVATNGNYYRQINPDRRKEAADTGVSLSTLRKSNREANKDALSAHAIIAKIIGAAAKTAGLSGQKGPNGKALEGQWEVIDFQRATTAYYDPIKKHVIDILLQDAGQHPSAEPDGKTSPKQRLEKKLVSTPQFKALALASAANMGFGQAALRLAASGRPQRPGDVRKFADRLGNPEGLIQEVARAESKWREFNISTELFLRWALGGDRVFAERRPARARARAAPAEELVVPFDDDFVLPADGQAVGLRAGDGFEMNLGDDGRL